MRWAADVTELYGRGVSFVLATVVECDGSAPREAGAKMVVCRDGTTRGTVGGGALEAAVRAAALELLEAGGTKLLEHRYPKTGCGGSVKVFLEHIAPPHKLLIFGGGHIGRALAQAMAGTSFAVTVVEERPDTLERAPWPVGVEVVCAPVDDAVAMFGGETGLYCIVAGFSARHDEQTLERLAPLSWHYLGVVGSRKKGELLRDRLRMLGVEEERLARFRCPAGLRGVGGKLPAEIAISIAAELLGAGQ